LTPGLQHIRGMHARLLDGASQLHSRGQRPVNVCLWVCVLLTLLCFLVLTLTWFCLAASEVIIVRHAECHLPPCGNSLCPSGLARAEFLGTFLANEGFFGPARIVAQDPTSDGFVSRELETLLPLSFQVRLPLESYGWQRGMEEQLAKSIVEFARRGVKTSQVIGWHHTAIGTLAKYLGCPPSGADGFCRENSWSALQFDKYLKIYLRSDGSFASASLMSMGFVPPCDDMCVGPRAQPVDDHNAPVAWNGTLQPCENMSLFVGPPPPSTTTTIPPLEAFASSLDSVLVLPVAILAAVLIVGLLRVAKSATGSLQQLRRAKGLL